MDDLLREFVGETLDMMDAVAGDLLAWEADPSDRALLDRIFRAVHTVKGSSGFFDLPRIAALAHATEELLDILRARRGVPDPAVVAAILTAIARMDRLTRGVAEIGGEAPGDDGELIAALGSNIRAPRPEEDAGGDAVTGGHPGEAAVPPGWRTIRLPVALLDELVSRVGDTALARDEIASLLDAKGGDPSILTAFDRLSGRVEDMRTLLGRMRMVPLRHLFAPLPRLVRQVARDLGKTVVLELTGGDAEIDRELAEALRDPLAHVLRNAIDHGIEPADMRSMAGKSTTGTLRITTWRVGERIVIALEDDGGGLPLDALVDRAVAGGHVSRDQAARLDDAARAALAFLPGLSTARAVTRVSGRGVGMDVVRTNVERLGGLVRLRNRPGQGLAVEFDMPASRPVAPGERSGSWPIA